MRKKNTIRLNESELKSIVKESVKKTVNEVTNHAWKSVTTAAKKANEYGEDATQQLSDELTSQRYWLREGRQCASDLYWILVALKSNPRINKRYIQKLLNNCSEIEEALDDDGPITDAVIIQLSNRWDQKTAPLTYLNFLRGYKESDGKPYKARDIWEPSNYDEEK